MMGIKERPDPKLFYTGGDLNARIPADHVLRRIDKLIDFSFVREQVAHLYGRRGNESIDPAVVLKLMFLLFYENVASERSLMEQMSWRLDWLWFCGYGLEDSIPNHSIVSKARRRWGPDVFRTFFANVLEQCVRAGLVDGQRVYVDSSLVQASADMDRLQPALRLRGQELYDKLEQAAQPESTSGSSLARTPAAAPTPTQVQPAPEASPSGLISPTDPDARLTRKYGQTVLGYKDHRVVDDRCGIITATATTHAGVADGAMLGELLDQHQFNVHQPAREVAADKAYGTAENYRDLQQRGVQPCVPHERYPEPAGKFRRAAFTYDPQRNGFTCPAGQFLGHSHREERYRRTRYRASGGVCARCSLKAQCTSGKTGRLLSRYDGQPYIDWADACGTRLWRRRMMRGRKIRAEGSFADAVNNHGYKRARWRGLAWVTAQNDMIAAVQNARTLLRAARRHGSQGTNAVHRAVLWSILTIIGLLGTLVQLGQAARRPAELKL